MEKYIKLLTDMAEKFGTKFMVTVLYEFGLWSLMKDGKLDTLYGVIFGFLGLVVYSFARHIQEKNMPT